MTTTDETDHHRSPGPDRAPLSRAAIVHAAIAIADAEGVDGLSMRGLAKQLGYEAMSLYNHVANKDDLLDAMVDRVAAEIVEPDASAAGDWQAAARDIAMSAHEAMLRHPWAAALWGSRWPGPARWSHMEHLLVVLAGAGFPDDVADLAFHAITLHVHGFTQQQISYRSMSMSEEEMDARIAEEVAPDRFPHVLDHIRYHLEREPDHDEFGFVLDLILEGLERRRIGSGAHRAGQ